MELSLRFRHWTILQVIVVLVCYPEKVLCEIAQGCVESQLSLMCPEMNVIQITSIVLGDSSCTGASCCIKDSDCTRDANANHRAEVHSRCNNIQSCTVGVFREKIPCGFWGAWSNNDFERITYNCMTDPQRSTTSMPNSTENIVHTEENPPKNETENESSDKTSSTDVQSTESFNQITTDQVEIGSPEYQSDNPWVLPVVMTTVCLLIVIAIVFVVFIMRRKRELKDSAAIEMTENDSILRNEAINENENQTISLSNGNGSPSYISDKTKNSNDKDTNVSQNYEVPNNCVADNAGSAKTEHPNIHYDVYSREPAYQVPRPRDDVYSVVRDVGEPERAGSIEGASIVGSSVYCNVEIREPAKAKNSTAQNAYDEAINWKESEYEAVRPDETLPQDPKKKEANNPAHKRVPVSYTKVNKPSRSAVATSETSEKAASKDKVVDGFPNPIYETMSPLIPESTYANAPVLSPNSSVLPSAIPMEANVTENPYCEMKSSLVRSKDNGN